MNRCISLPSSLPCSLAMPSFCQLVFVELTSIKNFENFEMTTEKIQTISDLDNRFRVCLQTEAIKVPIVTDHLQISLFFNIESTSNGSRLRWEGGDERISERNPMR